MSDQSVKKQFYQVLWKGKEGVINPSWNNIVPSWSRPNTNGVQSFPEDYQSPFGTARPSKTWRKQLIPTPFSGKGKPTLDLVNAPGGSTSLQDISYCKVDITIYNYDQLYYLGLQSSFTSEQFSVNQPTYISELIASTSRNINNGDFIIAIIKNSSNDIIGISNKIYPPQVSLLGITQKFIFDTPVKIIENELYTIELTSNSDFNVAVNAQDFIGGILNGFYYKTCYESLQLKSTINGNSSFLTPQTPNNLYNNSETYNMPNENIYNKCISCDPVSNRIRSATTILSKKYYSDTKGYLQSRNQRFIQKYTTEQIPGNNYGLNIWPTDNLDNSQTYFTPNCPVNCNNRTITYYKPNNKKFGVQGAVDSSTRLQKLRVDTINTNANSFKESFGNQGISAASYKPGGNAPYFVKSNLNHCYKQIYHRNGNPTMCFKTPLKNMVHQSLTTTQVYPKTSKLIPTTTYPTI